MILRGLVLMGEELEAITGEVVIDSGRIVEVVERPGGTQDDIIMPGLVNCHTHIGDYIFKDRGMGLPLRELVKSPDGLKHRLLSEASPEDLIRGMRGAEDEMIRSGTTSFIDFREQGAQGIRMFRQAVTRIGGLALGRPLEREPENLEELLRLADGLGLDRVTAYDDASLKAFREAAGDKPIGVHVAEGRWRPGEVERALDTLSADLLIHLTHTKEEEIRMMAEAGKAAVLCPRSNLFLGCGTPPLDALLEEGVTVGLGTDNSMINSLNLFREMELALALMKEKRPREVLKMATAAGAKICGMGDQLGSIAEGMKADLIVLRRGENLRFSRDVYAAVVKRAGPENVALVLKDGEILIDRRLPHAGE